MNEFDVNRSIWYGFFFRNRFIYSLDSIIMNEVDEMKFSRNRTHLLGSR